MTNSPLSEYECKLFERSMTISLCNGNLTDNAKMFLRQICQRIGREFKMPIEKEIRKKIKDDVLNSLLENWKDYYFAKTAIPNYFLNVCRNYYAAEIYKVKMVAAY
jgi:hypothetical protein